MNTFVRCIVVALTWLNCQGQIVHPSSESFKPPLLIPDPPRTHGGPHYPDIADIYEVPDIPDSYEVPEIPDTYEVPVVTTLPPPVCQQVCKNVCFQTTRTVYRKVLRLNCVGSIGYGPHHRFRRHLFKKKGIKGHSTFSKFNKCSNKFGGKKGKKGCVVAARPPPCHPYYVEQPQLVPQEECHVECQNVCH